MGSRSYPDLCEFQQRTTTTEPSGQVVEIWATAFSRWAKVEQTGANEGVADDQQRQNEAYRIAFPIDSAAGTVTAREWRVRWRNQFNQTRTLNLTGVDTSGSGRAREILMTAEG